jgi:diguanylate cyclase (GGDEF)-like protein/PAS domain S-box-containing protein
MSATQTDTRPPQADEIEIADLDRDLFDAEQDEHLDADTLQGALTSLLALYPDAPVAAHSAEAVMVAMPTSVPLLNNPILEARSGADLAVYDEHMARGWERVLAEGAARYPVHPIGYPDLTSMVYGLDMRETHGVVVILVVVAVTDGVERQAPAEIPKVTPRFASMRKNMRAVITDIDEATTELLGWTAEEMIGERGSEFMHPDDRPLAVDNWMEMLASPGPGRRVRLRHRRKDNGWVWFEVTNHNLLNDPDYGCVVSEIVDISDEMAAHELLDGLARAIPVGLFQIDTDRQIVYTNDRLHEILGVEREDTVEAQLATVTDADRATLSLALDEVLASGRPADIEVELRMPASGELRFCAVGLRVFSQDDGPINGAIACVADITDSTHMREELRRRATFDELTGCYNRASIMNALETNIASGERQAERAVVFVDLDRFKDVNDRHGHATGDELLNAVAERLRSVVRQGDMVGRIGGDEFLAVCPDIGGPGQAMKLAERLAEAQLEEVVVANGAITVQVSIGVAWTSGDEADAEAMVAMADTAMYESKREGAGRPRLASTPAALRSRSGPRRSGPGPN